MSYRGFCTLPLPLLLQPKTSMPSNFYSADTTSVFFGLQRAEELRKEGNQPESDNEYQSAVQQTISVLGNQVCT